MRSFLRDIENLISSCFLSKNRLSVLAILLDLRKSYADLSKLAHPTRDEGRKLRQPGCEALGMHADAISIEIVRADLELEKYEDLYRVLWLVLDQDERFVSLPIDEDKLSILK